MQLKRVVCFTFILFAFNLFQVHCIQRNVQSTSNNNASVKKYGQHRGLESAPSDDALDVKNAAGSEYKARVEEVLRSEEDDSDCDEKNDNLKEYQNDHSNEKEYEVLTTVNKVSYNGSQLWKLNLTDSRNKGIILKLRDRGDISVWGGSQKEIDTLVKPTALQKVSEILKNRRIPYEIVIKNVQEAIENENPPPSAELQELSERKGHRLTWKSYHRLNDIYDYIEYLGKTYPKLCKVMTIGTSTEKRPLKVLKVSNGNPKNKAVWIDGGIHAREWISPATVTYIINTLVEGFDSLSPRLSGLDWYFLPVANPDGYEYSHNIDRLWRKNRGGRGLCTGVDLNRNFGYKWGGKGVSKNPCTEIYGGAGPFSEPETAAIRTFIDSTHANWKAYISFHSYGQYILYPWGYDNFVPPDHADLQLTASKAAAAMNTATGSHYKFGPAASTLYPASGGSDDWAKGTKNIKYTYTIELRDTGRFGFILPSSYIIPTAKEALLAVEVIATAASNA